MLHGMADADRVISNACFNSGRSVAIDPADMPRPTSTVLQIAKSVVRKRKSPLYPLIVVVYGKRIMVAVEPLFMHVRGGY